MLLRAFLKSNLIFGLLASTAMAQDAEIKNAFDLGTLVLEADNRIETAVSESTRSVTVITQEDIEQQSTTSESVADILSNSVPGFSQSTEARTDFGQTLRGQLFLTLIDGVPQSTPLRDGRRSLNSIDPASIERIEIVRGGNAVYGFGATGGTINIITKRPEKGARRSFVSAGLTFSATNPESDSISYETQFGTSGRIDDFDYVFDAAFSETGSYFDADGLRIPSDPNGAQGGTAESETVSILGKVGYNFDNDRQRLQFSVLHYDSYQQPEFGGISFAGDPANDIRTPATPGNPNPTAPGTQNTNINIEYSHEDLFGSFVKAQIYYQDIATTFGKFPGFPQTLIESEKFGGRLTINTPLSFINDGANLTWGLDVLNDETQQTATDLENFFPGLPQPDPVLDQFAIAAFAQLEVPVTDRFKVTGGVRYEDIEIDVSDFLFQDTAITFVPASGGTVSFSEFLFNISGSYQLSDSVEIYGGFSQGFSVADIGRSLTDQSFATLTDVESEAQRTDNYELGLQFAGERWNGSLVGFFSTTNNGSTFDQDLNILTQEEEIWGIEATANFELSSRVTAGGTLSYIEGRVDTDGDGSLDEDLPTTRIPPLKVTAYVDYVHNDTWSARLQGLYSGTRSPSSTAFGGTSDIDDYFLVDAYASINVGPGKLDIGIKNLFNADYTPVLSQAFDLSFSNSRGPGTELSARYTVNF